MKNGQAMVYVLKMYWHEGGERGPKSLKKYWRHLWTFPKYCILSTSYSNTAFLLFKNFFRKNFLIPIDQNNDLNCFKICLRLTIYFKVTYTHVENFKNVYVKYSSNYVDFVNIKHQLYLYLQKSDIDFIQQKFNLMQRNNVNSKIDITTIWFQWNVKSISLRHTVNF